MVNLTSFVPPKVNPSEVNTVKLPPRVFTLGHPVAGPHTPLFKQTVAAPPTHTPPEQVSLVVHGLLSEHNAVLLVFPQVLLAHVSVVQGLLSLHEAGTVAVPSVQTPLEQTSPVVQILLSLQDEVLLLNTQAPVVVLHESVVQTLLSLQVFCIL